VTSALSFACCLWFAVSSRKLLDVETLKTRQQTIEDAWRAKEFEFEDLVNKVRSQLMRAYQRDRRKQEAESRITEEQAGNGESPLPQTGLSPSEMRTRIFRLAKQRQQL